MTLLRHPGAIAHVRKAGRQAEMELSAIRDDAQALGYEVIANVCDVEQAKLFISKGRLEEARPLLERALVFSERSSEREGADRIRGLLTGTLRGLGRIHGRGSDRIRCAGFRPMQLVDPEPVGKRDVFVPGGPTEMAYVEGVKAYRRTPSPARKIRSVGTRLRRSSPEWVT